MIVGWPRVMGWITWVAGVLAVAVSIATPSAAALEVPTFATGNVPDRERYVSANGSDASGDGSRNRPFRTINRAARGATAGTAIRLFPGLYGGGHSVENLQGTAEAPIWIGGMPNEARPVLSGGGEGLHLTRVRYVVLENLEVRGATANGINCDDGGDYAHPEATRFVVFRNLKIEDIGSGGNNDGLKLSGVNDYWVLDCEFARCGGSGIDHVGCHRGVVAGCRFEQMSANAIQCKGGSEDIEIRGCVFRNAGLRAVNIGGSTGFQFFRPPLRTDGPNVEARNIRVVANRFEGSDAPVAFVGCTDSLVAHNTIIDPTRWVLRILQETVSSGGYVFLPSQGGRFVNNLVSFRRAQLSTFVNVGPNTDAPSFTFAHNLWHAWDQPSQSRPSLPATETGGVIGLDPGFVDRASGADALRPNSPAVGKGLALPEVTVDRSQRTYAAVPTIGAYEVAEVPVRDRDADGMPDAWEQAQGLDPGHAGDAHGDPDADGAPSLAEYEAGTDPRDVRSVLRILGFGQEGEFIWIRFSTVVGREYALEESSAVDDLNWREVTSLSGWGTVVEGRARGPQPGAALFLRVRVEPLVP